MKSLTPKEKWFHTFAKEAAFTLSPTAFRKSADKAQKIFLAAEQQGISEKTICGRIGEPEMVVRKADDEERQIWRKPAAVLAALSILFMDTVGVVISYGLVKFAGSLYDFVDWNFNMIPLLVGNLLFLLIAFASTLLAYWALGKKELGLRLQKFN